MVNVGRTHGGLLSNGDKIKDRSAPALKVIVVGGGIGGFVAAVTLRQQGHEVEVFEQSNLASEIGAAIHMTPNATGLLLRIGVDPGAAGAVHLNQTRFFSANNELLITNINKDSAHRWQNPWLLAHRAHLHNQLKTAAISAVGIGRPVVLYTSRRVVSVDPETAIVTFDDGTQRSCDIVVGADGVHSRTRKAIAENAPEAFRGQHSAFRFLIPRSNLLEDPETRQFATELGSMDMWYGPDRKIVLYPTANNEILNFVCIHPALLSEVSDDYNKSAPTAKLVEVYKDFNPSILKMFYKADPETIKVYPLFDMEVLPRFIKNRLALIGDAAHPFTPHLGQGGAQAIEDAISLGVMLRRGVTPDEIPARLQLYNQARYERSTTIQGYSRSVGDDGTSGENDRGDKLKVHEVLDYGFSHDEHHASTQILRDYLWKQQSPFWRQPTVFGPFPGPRQDHLGNSRKSSLRNSRSVKATVMFKTSATLLRNLFPNSSYSFPRRDTVAVAGFAIESLRDMEWLGGGGYDLLGFYIYGVNFTASDGKVTPGTYCPVMFENLTDPILSGREELGVPKVYSDITVNEQNDIYRASVSWRGSTWAEFTWNTSQLPEEQTAAPSSEFAGNGEGLLLHKYMPATAHDMRGQPDAEYDVFIPNDSKASVLTSRKVAPPGAVQFIMNDLAEDKLPTLHHIVSRLAELPVFEITEGRVEEFTGVTDLSGAERLN